MDGYTWLPLDSLIPNPRNPRTTSLSRELLTEAVADLHDNQFCLDCSKPVDEEDYLRLLRRLSTKHQFDRSQIAEFKRYLTLAIDMKGDPERLINPIRYIEHEDGSKEISMGSSRWFAHLLMGADKIKAEAISYADDEERIDRELSENIQRTEMSDADIVLALRHAQLARGKSFTVTELSQKTAKSRGTANMIQKILSVEDKSFFDSLHEYKSIHGMLKAIEKPKADPTALLCDDEAVAQELLNATSLRLFTVNGHGSQMGSIMAFLNDFLGAQLSYYESVYDRNNNDIAPHVLDYMEVQIKTLTYGLETLSEEMARYNNGVKGKPSRYIYDKERLQLVADILTNASFQRFEQMRGFADDILSRHQLNADTDPSRAAS